MSGDNARLLVVSGSITSQLEDLGCQILHDCCHVYWRAGTHPLGVVALPEEIMQQNNLQEVSLPEEPVYSTHWKL